MDLRMFFQKLRKIEQEITTPHVVVVSIDTPDGGRDGVNTEVSRETAAKLLVEGKARLATQEETDEYHKDVKLATKEREREQIASRLTVNVLSDEDFAAIRKPGRKQDQ